MLQEATEQTEEVPTEDTEKEPRREIEKNQQIFPTE